VVEILPNQFVMSGVRVISNRAWRSPRSTKAVTLVAILARAADLDEYCSTTRARLFVSQSFCKQAYFSVLSFRSAKGDDVWFALPISRSCRVLDTLGRRKCIPLEHLNNAEVDCDGNVDLPDGSFVHAVSFEIVPLHYELPELEEAIVYLTIRFLGADKHCIRGEDGLPVGIDYSTLPSLRVENVRRLTAYINREIRRLGFSEGVKLTTVQRTLSLVGVCKARGRRPNVNRSRSCHN
jgi:hypothetical protein